MNWLSAIFSLITLIVGFSLSEFSKLYSEKRSDKKKVYISG